MALLEELNVAWSSLRTFVKTADGTNQDVLGYVYLPVAFNNTSKNVKFFIVPSLTRQLILGINFWKAFDIYPQIVSEIDAFPKDDTNHRLTMEQQQRLDEIVFEFPSYSREGLGRTTFLKHSIDVGDTEPIRQRHYPLSPAMQKVLDTEIDRMVQLGVIEESNSDWSSPLVMVKKPNGKIRVCLDSRKVNEVTRKNAYPLPQINGILGRVRGTKFITSLDLKDAFWQIELDKSSRDKTAFVVPGRGLYQFVVMPFGLTNSPKTMCKLMDRTIPYDLHEDVFVYLDDLLIISEDFETHLQVLKRVAKCLRKAGLTINIEKSRFCQKRIKYLGHIISEAGIQTDPEKIAAIQDFPRPKTVRQVRRFLGLSGWYRRFIPNYASLVAPITDLLKKNARGTWSEEAEEAFLKVKSCLTEAPVLANPNFNKPFVIQCDASTTGIGSVLCQNDDEGNEHPVAFMSQKLNAAQKNYSITELECLAAVLSIKRFRPYVEGTHFTVITDHASLKWLMSQKDLSGRLARWSLKLQGYSFEIKHRKGSENIVADALSRVEVEGISTSNICFALDLRDSAFEDSEYREKTTLIENQKERFPDLKVENGVIYRRGICLEADSSNETPSWKIWVPQQLTKGLIEEAHDIPMSAHCGIAKTVEKLQRLYYWPRMAAQTREHILNCQKCKECKPPNECLRPPMGKPRIPERPWQYLNVDLLGPYPRSKTGNTTLVIALDPYTKFVLLKPIRRATAKSIVSFLEKDIFHLFGVPESLTSDNGAQFTSREFQEFLKSYGVTHNKTALYTPQANASERVNRSVLSAIRAYIEEDQRTWDENISAITCALRNVVHDSTGFSPYYLTFGQHMVTHGSAYELLRRLEGLGQDDLAISDPVAQREIIRKKVLNNLQKARSRHEKRYNLRCRPRQYLPGQEVYRRNFSQSDAAKQYNAKLDKKFVKCRIVKVLGSSCYEVEDLKGKRVGVFHAKDLKPG